MLKINNYRFSATFSLSAFGLALYYLPYRSLNLLLGFFMIGFMNEKAIAGDLEEFKRILEERSMDSQEGRR